MTLTTNEIVAKAEENVLKARQMVDSFIIKTKEDYTKAIDIGTRIKELRKEIEGRREEITKPLNEALKSVRSLFKPLEDGLEMAENALKSRMLAFREIERQQEEEALKIVAQEEAKQKELLAKGEVSAMEATKAVIGAKIGAFEAKVDKTIKTEKGSKSTEKFITTYEITDKSLIPLVFLEPNMAAIKQAFKEGQPVPGVKVIKKPIITF